MEPGQVHCIQRPISQKRMKAWFAIGGDKMPFLFDFNEWLKGEHVHIKRIKGELDTDLPFVNV